MATSNSSEQTTDHGDPSAHSDHDLIVAKVLATIVLGQVSFLLGVVPLKLTKRWRTKPFSPSPGPQRRGPRPRPRPRPVASAAVSRAVSLLLCLGGGALMCTTSLRLQPAAREAVDALQRDGRLPGTEHLGDALFCAGFFVAFLADELAHAALARRRRECGAGEDALRRTLSLRRRSVLAPPARPGSEAAGGEDRALRGLFTVLALSWHELLAGAAIGLERRADHAWCLFLAVAAHKLVVAGCVGLELAWSVTRRSALVVYVAAFAAVTPVGVAFGAAMARRGAGPEDGSPGPAAVVLQGLATGALLYVVFVRVLPPRTSGWSHLVSVVVGFGVLLML